MVSGTLGKCVLECFAWWWGEGTTVKALCLKVDVEIMKKTSAINLKIPWNAHNPSPSFYKLPLLSNLPLICSSFPQSSALKIMKKAISYSTLLFFLCCFITRFEICCFLLFFIANVQNFNYIKMPCNPGIYCRTSWPFEG